MVIQSLSGVVENSEKWRREISSGKRPPLKNTAWPLLDVTCGYQGICANVVTIFCSEREFIFPFATLSLPWFFQSVECSYDFWVHTNSTWKGRTTNMGNIEYRIICLFRDLWTWGRKGPPLMWFAASVCSNICMCMCGLPCVCIGLLR